MRKQFVLILAGAVMGAWAVCLLLRTIHDEPEPVELRLETIQAQLADLKELLADYKRAHGRYPTNDEGLAVLNNHRIRVVAHCLRTGPHDDDPPEALYQLARWGWILGGDQADLLTEERARPDDFTTRLHRVGVDVLAGPADPNDANQVNVLLGIGRKRLFAFNATGPLTPWLVPYVYENRQGSRPDQFDGSPANVDAAGQYSVRVDDGVYVYSVGAMEDAKELRRLWWEKWSSRAAGALLSLGAAACVVLVYRTSPRTRAMIAMSLALGAGIVGVLPVALVWHTCYEMAAIFRYRDPTMVAQQRALLEKYRAKGVLGEAAYGKALAALDGKAATQPAEKAGDK